MLFAVTIGVALAAFSSHTNDPLPIGSPLPKADVKLKDISGAEVSLGQALSGKGLLVMFSCNTCPYVMRNQERTLEACRHAREMGVGVVILNSNEAQRDAGDSFDDMQSYAKEQGYAWYYLLDDQSKIADAFGANRTPECFLFNGQGKLVYHGAIDDNPADPSSVTRKHLVAALDEMTAGKDITVKESRSVGCGIKRL